MEERNAESSESKTKVGLGAVGAAAFIVACCGSAPILAGLLSGIALTTFLGLGAAVIGALALAGMVFFVRRARRRACVSPTTEAGDSTPRQAQSLVERTGSST